MSAPEEITRLLADLRGGDGEARDRLLPLVYDQLRAMARSRLSPRDPSRTLDTTELVHEAYLKLFHPGTPSVQDRRHFFAVAAMAMRQIVVDHARRRRRLKRGAGARPVDLDAVQVPVEDGFEDLVSLDDALRRLTGMDERLGRVVELRFFGGLTVEETAEVLEVDPRTVKRDWRKARALLYTMLGPSETV